MTVEVAVEHRTAYRYDRLVTLSPHVIRLRPAPQCRTPIVSYALSVRPEDHFVNWQQDPFGNHLARFVFPSKTRELVVAVELVADLTVINPFDFFIAYEASTFPFVYDSELGADLAPYLMLVAGGPILDRFLASLQPLLVSDQATIEVLVAVNRRVAADVAYSERMEEGVQSPEETLDRRIGSCRDSAWLLVQVLRRMGLAARFASGYLIQLKSDGAGLGRSTGGVADFTGLHAWAEVYIPGAGWIGLDPTSGLLAGEGHIPLACTPRPSSAAPISGGVDSAGTTFEFTTEVRRIGAHG